MMDAKMRQYVGTALDIFAQLFERFIVNSLQQSNSLVPFTPHRVPGQVGRRHALRPHS